MLSSSLSSASPAVYVWNVYHTLRARARCNETIPATTVLESQRVGEGWGPVSPKHTVTNTRFLRKRPTGAIAAFAADAGDGHLTHHDHAPQRPAQCFRQRAVVVAEPLGLRCRWLCLCHWPTTHEQPAPAVCGRAVGQGSDAQPA